jgi:hypothetical protein
VLLPTVTYLGTEFVPAFTSAGRLARRMPSTSRSPGENEPDQVDAWISAYAEPFYIRA